MFQKILGLDLGSHAIKAVLMRRGFKGPQIERCLQWPAAHAAPGSPPLHEWLAACLRDAGIRTGTPGAARDGVVASVPSRSLFTHLIRLPFADPQQVAQTVRFEMEGQIPFDLEDVVVDFHPIQPPPEGDAGGSGTTVLAFAVPNASLRNHLEELQAAGLDPKAFEVDSLALFNFSQFFLKEEMQDLALLDLGASKTSVCIVQGGKLRLVRTLWIGGNHLTQALGRDFNLSPEQAEQEKKRVRLAGEPEQDEPMAKAIAAALEPLAQELEQTFHVYEMQSGRRVERIYACGGTALLSGLPTYFSRRLGKTLVPGAGVPEEASFAVGIGLALKECLGQKGSRVHFRLGDFAYRRGEALNRRRLMILGASVILLLMLAGGNLYLRYHLKSARYQELQSHVRTTFQETFPEVQTIVNEVEQARTAQKAMEKKVAFFGGGSVTVLELLGELTRRMPSDSVVEVQDLLVEQDQLRLEAETDSFEAVEKYKALLQKFEKFHEVTISDAKLGANQKKVRFRMTISLAEAV